MEEKTTIKMNPLESLDYTDKTVLLRPDINCPLDPETKKIVNDNRIVKSLPTLKYLIERGAKTVIIAHQGDTLDYDNLIPMQEHADRLSGYLERRVEYIDDVCGQYAIEKIKRLKSGETILAGNLRYLTEEVSTFENYVNPDFADMLSSWPVRSLGKVCDLYVNDAFSAAHRNSPSMTAFQKILPCAAGRLLLEEYSALKGVMDSPGDKVFLLGGAKISDAFGMLKKVLEDRIAKKILTFGITGQIMLMAKGYELGEKYEKYLEDRGLLKFVNPAKEYLKDYGSVIEIPADIAYKEENRRKTISILQLPVDCAMFSDIGPDTVSEYNKIIKQADVLFMNGPAGVYEDPIFGFGTENIFRCMIKSRAYSVIGGGDTVSAAREFTEPGDINYICTGGGAMIRFMSGMELPLIKAMEESYEKRYF